MLEEVTGKSRGATGSPRAGGAADGAPTLGAPARAAAGGASTVVVAGDVCCDLCRGVATLTLARPGARNALTGAMVEALHAALDRIEADPTVRLVVLRGEPLELPAAGARRAAAAVRARCRAGAGLIGARSIFCCAFEY